MEKVTQASPTSTLNGAEPVTKKNKTVVGLFIFYVVVLLVGCGVIYKLNCPSHDHIGTEGQAFYRAARYLTANHQLVELDLIPPLDLPDNLTMNLPPREALVGKYMVEAVTAGNIIQLDNLQPLPLILSETGHVTISFPVNNQPVIEELLDAGTAVDIMRSNEIITSNATVLALLGGCQTNKAHTIVLAISTNQISGLAACTNFAELRLKLKP
jgi:uncharacterized protein YceK